MEQEQGCLIVLGYEVLICDKDTDGAGFSYDLPLVREYYARIPGAVDTSSPGPDKPGNGTSWALPCNATLPDLQIRFGKDAENTATIYGEHFNMGEIGGGVGGEGVRMCASCFTAAFGRNFGAPFLMGNFVAFSFPQSKDGKVEAPRVGVAGKVWRERGVVGVDEGGEGDGGNAEGGGNGANGQGSENGSGKKETVVVVEDVVEEVVTP